MLDVSPSLVRRAARLVVLPLVATTLLLGHPGVAPAAAEGLKMTTKVEKTKTTDSTTDSSVTGRKLN